MTIELRPYQNDCIEALLKDVKHCNPVLAAPTGSGKTYIIGGFLYRYLGRNPTHNVLVVSHTQDILEQDHAALKKFFPSFKIGLYSAGLDTKTIHQITVAGIQSIYRKKDRVKFKDFDLVLIDECHAISPNKKSMYMQFFESVRARYVGMSATVFRVGQGYIYGSNGQFFDKLSYDLTSLEKFNELVEQGYLTKLYSKATFSTLDTEGIRTTSGDFNKKELNDKFNREEITREALKEVLIFGKYYKSWLIFAINIDHANKINDILLEAGIKSDVLHSEKQDHRSKIKKQFINQEIQALVSVGMITTGFDAPNCDMIVLLRPTKSAVLHIQMIGRGLRISPGTNKDHCLVLDFSNNTERLGPINDVVIPKQKGKGKGKTPVRICPRCANICHASDKQCKACNYVFPVKEKIQTKATNAEIVRKQKIQWYEVQTINYNIHHKRDSPDSFKVTYTCGFNTVSEYICLDHMGWAESKAKRWVAERWTGPLKPPSTVKDLYWERPYLKIPRYIQVSFSGKFPEILAYKF